LERGTLTESNENLDPKVYSLCDEAVKKIDDLEQKKRDNIKNVTLEITKGKKEIVVELAELLEHIIPQTDTISTTILKLLKGRASKSLIHSCLPAKYKQEYRRKNAFKQNKKKIRSKVNLAPLSALNQKGYKEVEAKEEVEVMIGADGRSLVQREDDGKTFGNEPEDYSDYSFKDNTFNQASASSQRTDQERQSIDNEDRFDSELERQKLNNINDQNFEHEDILKKPSPLTDTSNKSEIAEGASVEQSFENEEDVLSIKFPMPFNYLQSRIGQLRSKIDDNGIVWIKTVINLDTSKVIFYDLGDRKHQNVAEKSCRNDVATIYTAGD
jgi:hypothetical protein